MTSDTNAGALDAGLDTALLFVEKSPSSIPLQYSDKIYSNIIDKTFSARASTVNKGKALMLKLIEVSDPNTCTTLLLTKLSDKKPKIPPTCLDIIIEGIKLFGIKPYPIKDIIKSFPAILNGSNGPARESTFFLMLEIYRWVGLVPLQSLLDSLRPAQKTEFEKMVSDKSEEFASSAPRPTLFLKKERPIKGSQEENDINNNSKMLNKNGVLLSPSKNNVDARDYVEDVDVMKKLKNTEYFVLIKEEKWSEQLKGF
jgi:hypothetical protein